jgi:hypothetical protein
MAVLNLLVMWGLACHIGRDPAMVFEKLSAKGKQQKSQL